MTTKQKPIPHKKKKRAAVNQDRKVWGLFSRYGIEIEYMICDQETMAVKPISDLLIKELAGRIQNEISLGPIAVSNELALHVIELKTDEVLSSLEEAPKRFQEVVALLNEKANKYGALLVPTGMHPFMDPLKETKLWAHEQNPIYEAYNAIFNCSGHGWGNLQSTHLNLPFASEEEFSLLHRAIRLLLPLFPALSASSPVVEGRKTGMYDTRLFVYRNNQTKIPSIAGPIVPEDVRSFREYRKEIFEPMWRAIAPYDPNKLLQEEWLNSRGAITRFERDAIEIRVLDTQECPRHDAAILYAIVSMLKQVMERCKESSQFGRNLASQELATILFEVAKGGPNVVIENQAYLALFDRSAPCTVKDLLQALLEPTLCSSSTPLILKEPLTCILNEGPLAMRLEKELPQIVNRESLEKTWRKLSTCLVRGETFYAEPTKQASC